jgi:CBS-domain-containing membrane protein
MNYFRKMRGTTTSPPRVSLSEIFWSWLGAFVGISLLAYLNYQVIKGTGWLLLTGSLGASALLIYGAIKAPFSQPRNLLGGHILSALIGVCAYKLLPGHLWLASGLAVATSIAVMHATRTAHPPGSATALIAVIGDETIHDLGFLFVILPVAAGALILLLVALIINNIPASRRYPEYWF